MDDNFGGSNTHGPGLIGVLQVVLAQEDLVGVAAAARPQGNTHRKGQKWKETVVVFSSGSRNLNSSDPSVGDASGCFV